VIEGAEVKVTRERSITVAKAIEVGRIVEKIG
jgi:hypothetical protein